MSHSRTGKRSAQGLLHDGIKSVKRNVRRISNDRKKQRAVDILTKQYSIENGKLVSKEDEFISNVDLDCSSIYANNLVKEDERYTCKVELLTKSMTKDRVMVLTSSVLKLVTVNISIILDYV